MFRFLTYRDKQGTRSVWCSHTSTRYSKCRYFLSPSIIAIWPRTFSNRVWRSLLMACRKYTYIQWCISYIKLSHIDWVWFLIHGVFYITHNDAPQSVGLLWTSDQFVAETSTWQHTQHSQQTDIHAPGGIRTYNLSRRAAVDLRLRPRGYWGRQYMQMDEYFSITRQRGCWSLCR